MSMSYPNREHMNAAKTALRRARANLDAISTEAGLMRTRLDKGADYIDGTDARTLAVAVGQLAENLTIIETLREVREWHAADQADAARRVREPSEAMLEDALTAWHAEKTTGPMTAALTAANLFEPELLGDALHAYEAIRPRHGLRTAIRAALATAMERKETP